LKWLGLPLAFTGIKSLSMRPICPWPLASALVLLLTTVGTRSDWPQFRGPQASGVDDSAVIPTEWSVENLHNVRWKTQIPGLAHASPIVWGGRVYVATAVGRGESELKVGLFGDIQSADDQATHEWRLLSVETATGRIAWDTLGFEGVPRVKRHTKASHCNSTPATDGQRIVAIFGSEGLFCFNMEGERLWHRDLGPMDSGFFAVPSAQWGFASSPVLHDGKVIVLCDVQTNSFLAVYDAVDGRELWRTARADVPTWGTPTVADVAGKPQLLVNGWHHTGAYDLVSGKEIWRHDGGGDIPVPTPIVAHGFAYFTSAHGRFRPLQAIRLDAKGDITAPELGATNQFIAWSHARKGNYMQTPIVVGSLLFACWDNGIVLCLDARTGRIHYEERVRSGGDGFTASPVSDGRHLFLPSEQGDVHVVPVSSRFSVASTNAMNETIMSSPALQNGTLYLRTRGHLVAIGAGKQ
jgi:outer membrane protein assembly factor BamB